MSSLITIFILLVVFSIYYTYTKNKYRKYDNSPVNKRIDSIYSKWYRKSAYLLNRKNTTIYEIDKLLFSLKKELMNVGISKDDIESYKKMLLSYKVNVQFGIKDALIGILTFVTTNSLVTDYVKENKNNIFKTINTYFSDPKNVNQAINALLIFLGMVILFAFIWVIIKVATLETIHKKSQRVFVLNGLLKMWDYKEDTIIKKISDINQSETKTVYTNLDFAKLESDEFFDSSLGEEDSSKYFNAISGRFKELLSHLGDSVIQFIRFLVAISIPTIFGVLLSLTTSTLLAIWVIIIPIPLTIKVITSIPLLILIVLMFMMYFGTFKSTYEKYKKVKENKKTFSFINLIQLFLLVVFYFYIASLLGNLNSYLFWSMLSPILVIILSIFWTPPISTYEDSSNRKNENKQ